MTGYRRAEGAAVVSEGDVVYAAVLPDGPIIVLEGVAGLIWIEARRRSESTIAERVAAVTGAPVAEIRDEVAAFVEELVQRGLLVSVER